MEIERDVCSRNANTMTWPVLRQMRSSLSGNGWTAHHQSLWSHIWEEPQRGLSRHLLYIVVNFKHHPYADNDPRVGNIHCKLVLQSLSEGKTFSRSAATRKLVGIRIHAHSDQQQLELDARFRRPSFFMFGLLSLLHRVLLCRLPTTVWTDHRRNVYVCFILNSMFAQSS